MARVSMWRCDRTGTMVLREDEVTEEHTVSVYVGGVLSALLIASDGLEKEAALGHAIGQGWAAPHQVLSVAPEGSSVFLELTPDAPGPEPMQTATLDCISRESGHGVVAVSGGLVVSASRLLELAEELQRGAVRWRATGGVHAALIAQGDLTFTCEDISRHTSMDKAIGHALSCSWDLSNCVLVETGRIAAQTVMQAARARLPVLASRGATTSQAVALAEQLGITLVAFVRTGRMNIYSRPDRVVP
ncbi:MAG: formate dehydrogenase accessory sulfurtransferase FdhD [Candidatus Cryosericum sp.]